VFGGRLRERALLALLRAHYRSLFRRTWQWVEEPPPFTDPRLGMLELMAGSGLPPERSFQAADVIEPDDRVLDIGCGDGYLTRRFFASRCRHVDALDVEEAAIRQARQDNAAANIRYVLADAVHDPFPGDQYDVIIWDGAIGHFSAEATDIVLGKIERALAPTGIFAGSESLGDEGSDHLQFFATLDDVGRVLERRFPNVELRSREYRLPSGVLRLEGYWRCATDPARLAEAGWRRFSALS
jgi:SAM-dependent methyltransferase